MLVMDAAVLQEWFRSLAHLFFPRRCVVCGTCLQAGEEILCMRCNLGMPRTNYHLSADNPVERLFWGKVSLQRATSYFFYHKGSQFRQILHLLKYAGRRDVGETMGRFLATELTECNFFEGIDLLLPVPLHPRKERQRGYNQSVCIARGVSDVTGIPLCTSAVVRKIWTESQTRKSAYERWENVKDIFELQHPEQLSGKHVLIIDDVLTTGATLTACADALSAVPGIRISLLTLAVAGD